MESDVQFYAHLDDLLARRDQALTRFKNAGYPIKAWLGVRRKNVLGVRWVYYYIAGTSVRHITPELLKRRSIDAEPELLSVVAELERYDRALAAMLTDAKMAMGYARRLYATIVRCARLYELPSLRTILDAANPSGLPITVPEPLQNWAAPRRHILPFAARQWAVNAIGQCFAAIDKEVTLYRINTIGDYTTSQRGNRYARKIRIVLSSREREGVMPADARWALWLRAPNRKWRVRISLMMRPRKGHESGIRLTVSQKMSRTFLVRLRMQDHCDFFGRMAKIVTQLRKVRSQSRPMFYLTRRLWSAEPRRKSKKIDPSVQSIRTCTQSPRPIAAATLAQVPDPIQVSLSRLQTTLRNQSASVREITDE